MQLRVGLRNYLAWVWVTLWGCAAEQQVYELGEPSAMAFEEEVYPWLLRDCSMPACHGDSRRMLHIVGPGRSRLAAETGPLDRVTAEELRYSYDRTRSMIDGDRPAASRLLLKPLAEAAGGSAHRGMDSLGQDVYVDTDEAGFRALYRWVHEPADTSSDGGLP